MLKRTFKVFLGLIFIIGGLILWLTPIVPGWPLLIIGVVMIFPSQKQKLEKWLHDRKLKKPTTRK